MIITGVMSGSSLDGLDIATYKFSFDSDDKLTCSLLKGETIKHNHLKTLISRLDESSSLKDCLVLESEYSKWIAENINNHIAKLKEKPIYLSVHGVTVTHVPERGYSYQIGHGGTIAALTQIPTITDFRKGDIALGGKGTPLTPLLDMYFYSDYDMVVNLGGICNISYQWENKPYGYDLFPCNQVINHFARKRGRDYDVEGIMASHGQLHKPLYEFLIQHNYLTLPIPKSIDNYWIRHKFIPEMENFTTDEADQVLTFCEALSTILTQHAIKLNVGSALITGGGIYHPHLRKRIQYQFAENNINLTIPESDEIEFKECRLMALLAYLRASGKTNIYKTVTGASRSSVGGTIHL